MLEGIEMLSPFGVKIRYPGDFPELLPGQEQTVFDLAHRTREAIMEQLRQHLTGGWTAQDLACGAGATIVESGE